jgi:hypothetical protein
MVADAENGNSLYKNSKWHVEKLHEQRKLDALNDIPCKWHMV